LGYPFVIRVAVSFVTIFLIILLFDLIVLGNNQRVSHLTRKFGKEIDLKYAGVFRHIISSMKGFSQEEMKSMLSFSIKKLNVRNKQLLTDRIVQIRRQVDIVNRENYIQLLEMFDLRRFWEQKLKYGHSASRQKALRKIDDLDLVVPGSIIASLTHNRNQYVRKKAKTSYMYFSKNDPFKFLSDDFDSSFNDWDKVEIHRMLTRRTREEIPLLSHWVKNSENIRFQCFMVDEIKHFNQQESCPYLVEILDTPDIRLRRHVIDALGEMRYEEAEALIISGYVLQPQVIQRSIIGALLKINSGNALPFFEKTYRFARDTEGKMAVLGAIYHYGEAGRKSFSTLMDQADSNTKILFEHVSNPLIKQM
jgi:hypothetical protein